MIYCIFNYTSPKTRQTIPSVYFSWRIIWFLHAFDLVTTTFVLPAVVGLTWKSGMLPIHHYNLHYVGF